MNIKSLSVAIVISATMNLWFFQKVAADALRPVEVALGNWAPVIEEKRSGYGALTEKITIVLRRMGYRPTYSFMPWSQAELKVASNETDAGPRITFPYLQTPSRHAAFLYSEKPVFQACMKFFYHKGKISNPEMTRLTTLGDLTRYRIGYVAESAGFQYPAKISPIIQAKGKSFPGLYEAFEQLITDNASDVQVVPVAQVIGEHLLIELFSNGRKNIDLLEEPVTGSENDCLLPVDYYLLMSRKNPNNTEFMDSFNQEFARLEADKETVARIDRREKERGSLRQPLVRLVGLPSSFRILADMESGKRIQIPRGTQGILLDWSSQADTEVASPHATATVRIISGPYRGMTVTLPGEHLRLE
jgi:ABC-type amino acid transport substrate-binding protein